MTRELPPAAQRFCNELGIQYPVIGGAMYPCSNPELTAAVSEAGGIGILQPISLTYVHGHDYREGLRKIRALTSKPVGLNIIVEKSIKVYDDSTHCCSNAHFWGKLDYCPLEDTFVQNCSFCPATLI